MRKHGMYVLIIVIISMFFYQSYLLNDSFKRNELLSMKTFVYGMNREIIMNYHQFPLWNHYMFSGTPLFATPQSATLYFHALPFMLLMDDVQLALNWTVVLNAILMGLFMYIFLVNMKIEPRYAMLGALVWAFNGFSLSSNFSWIDRYKVMVYLPLTMLFLIRALTRKKWLGNSMLAGLFMSIQFFGGGTDFFMFAALVPLSYLIVYLIGNNLKARLLKAFMVGAVMSLIFLGLTAVKTMPMAEFGKVSSKEAGFSFEQSVGAHVKWKDVWSIPFREIRRPSDIGIVAAALMLFSFMQRKKRLTLFAYSSIAIGILITTGSFLFKLLWTYVPGYNALHHVARGEFIYTFGFAVLVAIGSGSFVEWLKKFKLDVKKLNTAYWVLAVLLIFSLFLIVKAAIWPPYWEDVGREVGNFDEILESNHMMQYLSKQPGLFRIENVGTRGHSGWTVMYTMPLGLQRLYGATSIWIPEYFNVYLAIAAQDIPKFYGIMNAKYLYHNNSFNMSGTTFLKKFKDCGKICEEDFSQDQGVDGPWLYTNDKFLPRAYRARHAVLLVGEDDGQLMNPLKQMMYGLMLDPSFNPANTVLVLGDKGNIDNYDIGYLSRFDAVILATGPRSQATMATLQSYVDNGGTLLPNLLEGRNSISNEEIKGLFGGFDGDYDDVPEAEVSMFTPNRIRVEAEKGYLVLSEKFFMFDGWKAEQNGRPLDIERANGMVSAIYLDEDGTVEFSYRPESFRNGLIITFLTLAIIAGYFLFMKYRRK